MVGIARSTFYYQRKKSLAEDKYFVIKQQIKSICDKHRGRYGYRRVTAAMRQMGELINHKTVQRLMKVLGLKSLVRTKRYISFKGNAGLAAPNRLKRNFSATKANQKWTTDVTEFNVAGEKLYLSPILDLFNGEIIAFETSRRPVYKMVESMLNKAFERLSPKDKPILHSDQGWQYRMAAYKVSLRSRGLVQSMSRKGNCLDNAAMESFFAVLKTEFFYLNKFTCIEQLEKGIQEYIHYYNHDRIKLKLKGLSPVQYRNQSS